MVYQAHLFCHCLLLFALTLARPLNFNPQPSAEDEAALHSIVERFFAAYSKEDLDGFMALWSGKSPEYAQSKRAMQKIFAESEQIEVKGLAIRKITVGAGVPTSPLKVRVFIEMSAVDVKTGKPAAGFGKMNRTLHLVKEDGQWKVWRYVPSEQDLVDALIAAKTKDERTWLLSEEKELVRSDLVRLLYQAADAQAKQEKFEAATRLIDLAFEVAEVVGDKVALAWCYVYRGHVFFHQSQHPPALENY